jgi:hypothetical protein
LQQKLFIINYSHYQQYGGTTVYTDQRNTLVATAKGPNETVSYIFKTFGNGWSLQSQLKAYDPMTDNLLHNVTTDTYYDPANPTVRLPPSTDFSNPTIWGGTLLTTNENEIQIRTQYRPDSCLRIWMSDHFLDGWDTAVLTVRAPDDTNNTFHPHCDQVS